MENLLDLVNGDEQRLNMFMSGLPSSRAMNPLQWDSTVDFWKARIINYCRFHKRASFTLSELFQHFETGEQKPWCLSVLLNELNRLGVIADLQSMNAKYSWFAWTTKYLLWTPVTLLASAKSYLPLQSNVHNVDRPHVSEAFQSQTFFIPQLVEELATSLQPKPECIDSFESVFSAEEFIGKYLSAIDCVQTKRYILETWKKKGIIKHGIMKGQEAYKLGHADVTEHDFNLLHMKRSVQQFEERIAAREKEHDDIMVRCKKALNTGNRNEAKRLLRQAKVMREDIDKFKIAVDRLHEAKFTIDNASLNAQFVGAVKSGTDAMKVYTSPKKVEEVHDVIEDLADQTALAQEISAAISTPSAAIGDMTELEEELAELMLSAKTEKVPSQVGIRIPEVPSAPVAAKRTVQAPKEEKQAVPAS